MLQLLGYSMFGLLVAIIYGYLKYNTMYSIIAIIVMCNPCINLLLLYNTMYRDNMVIVYIYAFFNGIITIPLIIACINIVRNIG